MNLAKKKLVKRKSRANRRRRKEQMDAIISTTLQHYKQYILNSFTTTNSVIGRLFK